jgi:DNA ligase-1
LEGKLRIGNAERSVLVALAHAAVLAEKERSIFVHKQFSPFRLTLHADGKKWSREKLATKLEEGANVIKAVYRYVF